MTTVSGPSQELIKAMEEFECAYSAFAEKSLHVTNPAAEAALEEAEVWRTRELVRQLVIKERMGVTGNLFVVQFIPADAKFSVTETRFTSVR